MLEDNDFFESQTQRSEEAPDSMPSEYREEEKEEKKGKKGTKSKEDSKEEPKKKGGRDYMSNDIGFPGSRRLANNGLLLFLNSVVSGNLAYFFIPQVRYQAVLGILSILVHGHVASQDHCERARDLFLA